LIASGLIQPASHRMAAFHFVAGFVGGLGGAGRGVKAARAGF